MKTESTKASDTENRAIWAVLIGIDRYSAVNSKLNLNGCVADVQETKSFLQSSLHVPAGNIKTMTAAVGGSGDTRLQPTKVNVINSIRNLPNKAKAGDFVYIHYSGHGDRLPTIYTDRKGKIASYDEVLCTLEEDIRDVELGDLLDSLVDKGLTVCVVLDSCHSGGATRHRTEPERVRCRSRDVPPGGLDENEQETSGIRGGLRNISTIESWLNRPRGYNLIAACQSHEVAQEITTGSRSHGALTYYLIESLRSFQASKEPVTYESLHQILEPKFRSLQRKQQPLHLGDKSRIVFEAARYNNAQSGKLTSVAENTSNKVTFVDGSAALVGVGDWFKIYSPPQVFMGLVLPNAAPVAEVRITRVGPFKSEAEPCRGTLKDVKVGWVAKMYRRAQGYVVNVRHHGDQALREAISSLKQNCRSYLDPLVPLDLRFEPINHVPEPSFIVEISQNGDCQISDRLGQQLPHLPPVNISHRFGVSRLTHLLQHLSSYRMVSELSPIRYWKSPLFKFDVQRMTNPPPECSEYLSIWEWSFKNEEKSQVLYITVLNLSPAYGVHQLYPGQKAATASVDPGETVSEGIGIEIPALLTTASCEPGFRMRDVIKVLVTTEATNFSHYEIDDLTDGTLTSGGRTIKAMALKIAPWHVIEKEIISTT